MSEISETLSNSVLWGTRLAAVGVVFAALSASVSLIDLDSIGLLYWAGILLAICGVSAAAIRGGQDTGFIYTGGVISAMAGVVTFGYGVDDRSLFSMLIGVAILVIGVYGVLINTQRTE